MPAPSKPPVFVMLGRYGDLLNVLPLLKEVADRGPKPVLVVSSAFADLLEGVSYVTPRPWTGDYSRLPAALMAVRRTDPKAVCLQVYGLPGFRQGFPSFVLDSWAQAGPGWADRWGTLPLVLDQRSAAREAALVAAHVQDGRPLILVASSGHSSPFPHARELFIEVRRAFPDCQVLDLAKVRAERFHDFLALYEKASVLVSIDTGHLHLAPACGVPVCALVTDRPTSWHGALRRPNHVFHARYAEFRERVPELIEAISATVFPDRPLRRPGGSMFGLPWMPPADPPVFRHVFVERPEVAGDEARRESLASRAWASVYTEGNWLVVPHRPDPRGRNARTVLSDPRPLAFIKDIVATAVEGAADTDIIVLTNSDISPVQGISAKIVEAVRRTGSAFGHRRDFPRLDHLLTAAEVAKGQWYCGSDLFCFTAAWWRSHSHLFPDMLIGCEWWDCLLRQLIKLSGGAEITDSVCHERHASAWERPEVRGKAPQSLYVNLLAKGFMERHGTDDKDWDWLRAAVRV